MVPDLPGDVLSSASEDFPKMRSRGSLTTTTGENDQDVQPKGPKGLQLEGQRAPILLVNIKGEEY